MNELADRWEEDWRRSAMYAKRRRELRRVNRPGATEIELSLSANAAFARRFRETWDRYEAASPAQNDVLCYLHYCYGWFARELEALS